MPAGREGTNLAMADPRMLRHRVLEQRVADTLAGTPPSFPQACPEESVHGTYVLTSTQQEAMVKQAREKMRRARLVQVRAQEMLLAAQRVQRFREHRRAAKQQLLQQLEAEWRADRRRRLEDLELECAAALQSIGHAHKAAAQVERFKEMKEVTEALQNEERRCCAALRYADALQKEIAKREEMQSKIKRASERRKQVENTAEMDRNLARVSAYGVKIKSKLRQIKEVFQPECKPDCEISKLGDYKYTFMHTHWAALKDRTNAKEPDTNAWEAADRQRSDHEHVRIRHAQIMNVAKKRISQRGHAAEAHLAKEKEVRRLERQLKNAEKEERERKVAAMLSGDQGLPNDDKGGAVNIQGSPSKGAAAESPRCVDQSLVEGRSDSGAIVESQQAKVVSPIKILVKSGPHSSTITFTVDVPGGDVRLDQSHADLNRDSTPVEVLVGSGWISGDQTGNCEPVVCNKAKRSVIERRLRTEPLKTAKVVAFGTKVSPRYRFSAKVGRDPSKSVQAVYTSDHQKEVDGLATRRVTDKQGRPMKDAKQTLAYVLASKNKGSKKTKCRKCAGCANAMEDAERADGSKGKKCFAVQKKRNGSRLCTSAAPESGGTLGSAVSLLGEIWGTAEFLDRLREAKIKSSKLEKLPSSLKVRAQKQLEALEAELYGEQQGRQEQRRENAVRESHRQRTHLDHKGAELPPAVPTDCRLIAERRKKELEMHKRRMDKRNKMDQVGQNLWNVLGRGEHGATSEVGTVKTASQQKTRKAARLSSKGEERTKVRSKLKLDEAGRSPTRAAKEKSLFSMQIEDIDFLKQLQVSLQKLKEPTKRHGGDPAFVNKVSRNYEVLMKGDKVARKGSVAAQRTRRNASASERGCRVCPRPSQTSESGDGVVFSDTRNIQNSVTDLGPWNIEKDPMRIEAFEKAKGRHAGVHEERHPQRTTGARNPQTDRKMWSNKGRPVQASGKLGRSIQSGPRRAHNLEGTRRRIESVSSDIFSEEELSWPEQLGGEVRRETKSKSTKLEHDSFYMMQHTSSSNEMNDIDLALRRALKLHPVREAVPLEQFVSSQEAKGMKACDEARGKQSVAIQVDSPDLEWPSGSDRQQEEGSGGKGEKHSLSIAVQVDTPDLDWASAKGREQGEGSRGSQTDISRENAAVLPLPLTAPQFPRRSGSSWERIWEEVCESIDGELERLAGADSLKALEEVRSSSGFSSVRLLKQIREQAEHFPKLHLASGDMGGGGRQPHSPSRDPSGRRANPSTYETDAPSMDSILGSLSEQVKELDERLFTATSSAVASSWVQSESSRRSRFTTSREDSVGTQLEGSAVGKREDTFQQDESLASMLEDCTTVVPRVQVRRATVYAEGTQKSEDVSSETGSPVSPIGLCFDTLHDLHQRRRDDASLQSTQDAAQGIQPTTIISSREGAGQIPPTSATDADDSNMASTLVFLPRRPRRRTGKLPAAVCTAVLASLSSRDLLDGGESLLTGSIDFSMWSPEKIRDIFDSPSASGGSKRKFRPLELPRNTGPGPDAKPSLPAECVQPAKMERARPDHRSNSSRLLQPAAGFKPKRALAVRGSPGKWSIKRRIVRRLVPK